MTTLAEIARKGAAVRAIAIAIAIAITKNATSFFMKPKILTELRDAPVYFSPALVRVEDAGERRRVDVAAAHHADDLLSCEPIAQLHRRRERRRTGTFGEIVRGAQRKADAGGELVFGERHDIVELALENAEREIEGDARRHPLGERIGVVADDARVRFPRARERVGLLCL